MHTRVNDGFLPAPGESDRKPAATVVVTTPDGKSHGNTKTYAWSDFSASKDRCDVRLGPCTFSGDLKTYRMKGESDGTAVDLNLLR
ncbi:hypothetical protein OHA19_42490 (plasmid) [Streptomyces sp. NBC_00012]|uniref:hypothetical protein n=1 Tax=unclassified Streptomyces TaxID=2593676 RepID=UPI002F917057